VSGRRYLLFKTHIWNDDPGIPGASIFIQVTDNEFEKNQYIAIYDNGIHELQEHDSIIFESLEWITFDF
jgi:hypothetical protein